MPEGDSVWRAARRLHRAFAGQPVILTDLRVPGAATADLQDRTTVEVRSRGKHLLHRFDDGHTLHSHLRMDGSWRLVRTAQVRDAALRRHPVRAVLATRAWTAIGDQLGMLDLVPTAAEDTLVGHLGPDILGAPGVDWDAARARQNLRADPERPLGAALLDQRNLAGIGTIYASEPLFLHRQHPWTPIGEVTDSELAAIVDRARVLMSRNCRDGIPTTTGRTRRGETTWVHGRSGRPCRRCGRTVRVAPIGTAPRERTMFYCPRCQGGLARTDDGRPQAPLGASRAGSR